ncbi:DUF1028 domain-containing protein [Streptomyces sp. SYSU K21746]
MTFSLAARCLRTGQFGVAVTSSSPAVAARCAHVRAGVGAACSQNVTDPRLGPRLLEHLVTGSGDAADAMRRTVGGEPHRDWRQLTVIGVSGVPAHHSGSRALGTYAHALGPDAVAAGNLLANPGVPRAMLDAFAEAHAAAYPEQGRNAADAFTVAQVAIGLLRQQLPPTVRVHGLLTRGGEAPNAIPERTEGRWYVRAATLDELSRVQPRVEDCFAAGALAAGCELGIEPESPPYSEFRADAALLECYRRNALGVGRRFAEPGDPAARMNRASTDMGNVSRVLPAIHPYIGIDSLPAVNHQKEFAAHCVTPAADAAVLAGATALALTAADLATDPRQRQRLTAGSSR